MKMILTLVSAVAGGREDQVTSSAFRAVSKGNSLFISSSNHLQPPPIHRRRIKTEEKAEVVAAVWGT